jgi:hypothetical protein
MTTQEQIEAKREFALAGMVRLRETLLIDGDRDFYPREEDEVQELKALMEEADAMEGGERSGEVAVTDDTQLAALQRRANSKRVALINARFG